MNNLETYKTRSAQKLIAIGQAMLGKVKTSQASLSRPPTGAEAMALEEIVALGPVVGAGTWAGDVYLLSGMFGEFNLPGDLWGGMVKAGQITQDGRLTEAAKNYRQEGIA